jgi:hypothetical protein
MDGAVEYLQLSAIVADRIAWFALSRGSGIERIDGIIE